MSSTSIHIYTEENNIDDNCNYDDDDDDHFTCHQPQFILILKYQKIY